MDPGQSRESCLFLDRNPGAVRLHSSPVSVLQPSASIPLPHMLESSSQDPPRNSGSGSSVSGLISISRPRPRVPESLGSRPGARSSRAVDPPAILPLTSRTASTSTQSALSTTNTAPISSSDPPQPRLQTSQLSPNCQPGINALPNLPTLPVPPSQTKNLTLNSHPGLIPKPPPNPSSNFNPVPKTGQNPEPNTSSPGTGTDRKLPLQKSTNEADEFRVHIVTWNVAAAMPPDDISDLFGPGVSDGSTDMFIVGLQEVNSMINKRLKDVLFTDQWSELCMDTLSRFGFVLVASQRMQGVLLLVFSKFCHLPFLRGIQTQSTRTGLGGCWGNKGGVSARMLVFGHPVCFLNCHLPAHMRNLEQRVEDFESILQQQQFEGGAAVGVLDHDVVFWFGDLNFRIEDYDIHVVKSAIENNKLSVLWDRDQLNMAKCSESVLDGFLEGCLTFPPTYKFDVGTNTYDTSAKKRKPAWTDRILWRLRRTGSPVPSHSAALQRGLTSWLGGVTRVTQRFYRSHMGFTSSDHKPVSALFSLQFPFKIDVPMVTLEVEKEWTKLSDATAKFSTASGFQRSSWDWVGLYKVGFRHHKDYAAYVWAKSDHVTQVTFPEEDLPRDAGEYILAYYSNNMNSIVGITEPFQVHLPVCTPPTAAATSATCPSLSDSSDASSEDDSTLVLLGATSRSPSPGTHSGKRHRNPRRHHRQRSRSPAVPAMSSAPPLPSLQSLSLRPRDGHARSASPHPTSAGTKKELSAAKKERLVSSPESLTSPSLSPLSPRSPRSPLSAPGAGVSVPEALVVAILGEPRPVAGVGVGDANQRPTGC